MCDNDMIQVPRKTLEKLLADLRFWNRHEVEPGKHDYVYEVWENRIAVLLSTPAPTTTVTATPDKDRIIGEAE